MASTPPTWSSGLYPLSPEAKDLYDASRTQAQQVVKLVQSSGDQAKRIRALEDWKKATELTLIALDRTTDKMSWKMAVLIGGALLLLTSVGGIISALVTKAIVHG